MSGPLEMAAQAGEVIGGLSAFGGVVFAYWTVNRWRRERLEERSADAAARGYAALRTACDVLAVWADSCSKMLRANKNGLGSSGAMFRQHNQWRDQHARGVLADLRAVASSGFACLDDVASDLLLQAEPIYADIRTVAGPIGAFDKMPGPLELEELIAWFDKQAESARGLKERAKALREIARFGLPQRSTRKAIGEWLKRHKAP